MAKRWQATVWSLAVLCLMGCPTGDPDGDPPGDDDDSADPVGPDRAWIFSIDPVATPDPVEVQLAWVADDSGGSLTAAEDHAGIRKIVATSCIDEGRTNTPMGMGEQRVCTLRQLANAGGTTASWTLDGLEAGTTVYLHPINRGASPCWLTSIEVTVL